MRFLKSIFLPGEILQVNIVLSPRHPSPRVPGLGLALPGSTTVLVHHTSTTLVLVLDTWYYVLPGTVVALSIPGIDTTVVH